MAASVLSPAVSVVPDLSPFDLDADHPGAFDGHDEVDLVVLEVIGDTLPGDYQVLVAELVDEQLPHPSLGGVREAGCLRECDRH